MSSQPTVHDLMVAPAVRDGTHVIEFRCHRGVLGYLRPRATGWDVMYPHYGAEFPIDDPTPYERWRVTWHDLDAPGRLVPIAQIEAEQAENLRSEVAALTGAGGGR